MIRFYECLRLIIKIYCSSTLRICSGQYIFKWKWSKKSNEKRRRKEILKKRTKNRKKEKNKDAIRYETVTFDEVYEKGLKVMDLTAFTLCNENKVPIIVFDMNKSGNLLRVLEGESVGTLVEF